MSKSVFFNILGVLMIYIYIRKVEAYRGIKTKKEGVWIEKYKI